MDQIKEFADSRLVNGCIYCGMAAETRDHVPSKCLLERPYPTNLPVVGCCERCNQDFSMDEEYLVCLIESVLCGSTEPKKISRSSVSKIMERSPALKRRIEKAKTVIEGQTAFAPEWNCVNNVMLKLARGHAAFELSQMCQSEPYHFWCGPLLTLPDDIREEFDQPYIQEMFGEVGSRNMQRLLMFQFETNSKDAVQQHGGMVMNDWIDVQDNLYRYLAIDDAGSVVIRIVIAEYLACEVEWKNN